MTMKHEFLFSFSGAVHPFFISMYVYNLKKNLLTSNN